MVSFISLIEGGGGAAGGWRRGGRRGRRGGRRGGPARLEEPQARGTLRFPRSAVDGAAARPARRRRRGEASL